MGLFISKIGGIKVIQAGDSKLDVTHKSEDGGKIGGFGHQGSNNTVDLGKGKRINTIKVRVTNNADNEALHNILYLERYTTITDKFRGTTNVYIDKFTMTDSDKHVGLTIYEITYTEQDDGGASLQSFGIRLFSDALGFISTLTQDIEAISSMAGLTMGAIDELEKGLVSIVDGAKGIEDPYFEATEKARIKKDIKEGVQEIQASKTRLKSAVEGIINFRTPVRNIDADRYEKRMKQAGAKIKGLVRGRTAKKNTLTEHLRKVSNYPISEASYVFKPKIGEKYISEDIEYIGIHSEEYICKKEIAYFLNKVKMIRGIKSILLGGYNSRSDFESEVDDAVIRLHNIGKREDEIEAVVYNLRAYANMQRYREIIEIEVKEYKPLIDIVYGLYGDTDDYDAIRDMNGFADNDRIIGTVKVYTRKISDSRG